MGTYYSSSVVKSEEEGMVFFFKAMHYFPFCTNYEGVVFTTEGFLQDQIIWVVSPLWCFLKNCTP